MLFLGVLCVLWGSSCIKNNAEARVTVAGPGQKSVAVGAAAGGCVAAPAAAAQHAELPRRRALRVAARAVAVPVAVVPVGAPLPAVAVHVVQAVIVRRERADLRGHPHRGALARLAVGEGAVEVRLLRRQRVAVAEGGGGAGAARVLPLGLG